jgi:hypothetical protein
LVIFSFFCTDKGFDYSISSMSHTRGDAGKASLL